jgi:hypothetical protein
LIIGIGICAENLYKAGFGIYRYQSVLCKNMHLLEYQKSYKGAAGKAFSAHMSTELHFPD